MLTKRFFIFALLAMYVLSVGAFIAPAHAEESPTKLLVLFTTDNKEVLTKMAGGYAMFSMKQEWWTEARFLIWGPSAKMIAGDAEAQEIVKQMKEAGVELLACKWCADQYGVSDKLVELGVDVKYMGQGLTDMLKSDWKVLTL